MDKVQYSNKDAGFLLDTSNQLNYFIDRTHALLKGIEWAALDIKERDKSLPEDRQAARIIAAYCGIIECDLDDLSDLSDNVGGYYII